jgi:S-adenosylmethionine synthetase
MIDTFGTGKVAEEKFSEAVRKVFELDPAGIIRTLDLKKPIYQKTASYGHFGRNGFSWERADKVTALQAAMK